MKHIPHSTGAITAARQDGIALVAGLIMITAMSLVAVQALRSAMLQERIAANVQQAAIAEQAAEAALRAGEAVLQQATLPSFDGTQGYYPASAPSEAPRWTRIDWDDPAAVQTYTGLAGTTGLLGTARAEFIVEFHASNTVTTTSRGRRVGQGGPTSTTSSADFYKITARGRAGTHAAAMLESFFIISGGTLERTAWRRLR